MRVRVRVRVRVRRRDGERVREMLNKERRVKRYHWHPKDGQKVYRGNPYRRVVMSILSLGLSETVDIQYSKGD